VTEDEVKARAYAMPLTSPAFPPGPYRFVNREYFVVSYRTDPDALRAVIPARFQGQEGAYVHAMFLDDEAPIAGGRELWGFPKKLASPKLSVEKDTLLGVLSYGPVTVAVATMGYKHRALASDKILASLSGPNYLIKIIPHVDGKPRICELVRYFCEDVAVKGAWEGPAALELFQHALAPVAQLPVLEVVSGVHIVSDVTLGLGTVIHDYLA
jgi:acetoacetate decarboxylase